MKKWIVRLFLLLVLLVLVGVVAAHFFLDGAIKKGVETFGPEFTKVSVKLDSANVILLSGSGSLKGLVVGNPEPYKSPNSISLGVASLAIDPASLLTDKIVINSINIKSPEVTFETDLKANNLSKILDNVQGSTGGGDKTSAPADKPASSGSSKKLQVNDFLMSGGKIHVSVTALGNAKSATVPLPEIHLKNLGTGPDGITAAELTKLIITEIENKARAASADTVSDLAKQGVEVFSREAGKTAGNAATNALDKATKGIGNLFKK
jgi:hypothetical protein